MFAKFAIPFFLASALFASGATTFSVDATVTSAPGSVFTLSEVVTFTFTTEEALGVPNNTNTSDTARWQQEQTNQNDIWSNVTVSGATGAWVDPAGGFFDPFNFLHADGATDSLRLYAGAEDSNDIGLSRNGVDIRIIQFDLGITSTFATFPADGTTTPDTVFTPGTYGVTPPVTDTMLVTPNGETAYVFTISQVTISSTVPEPSQTILLALPAFIALTRRSRKAGC